MGDAEVPALPAELVHVCDAVEDYVRGRLKAFAKQLSAQIAPGQTQEQILDLADSLLTSAPSPDSIAAPRQDLHLVFRHECLALGCRDGECTLCQFNPVRLCERNFGKKYLVGDALKAKCGAAIKVELVDSTGQRVEREMSGVQFEVNLIDGVMFKEKGGESRVLNEDDLKACFKLTNHKDEALLQHKNGGLHRKVVLKLESGQCLLPDLQVTDSSEALLTGRRPPFRLLVWAVHQSQDMLTAVHYAVSEEFVVATRRVKQANKADIPLVDDHVSKIEHIGRETVKKLQDLRGAAAEVGVELNLPEHLGSITTVGQFRNLVELADKDIQMRKILQIILKLSKEKWDEAANHTMQAVKPDFRKRVWYPAGHNMGIGLLFNCKYGAVQLKDPVALVQLGQAAAGLKLIPEDQLDPSSLNILRQLKAQAVTAWWTSRHPGWGVFREASSDPHAALPTSGYLPGAPAASPSPSLKPAAITWQQQPPKSTLSLPPSGSHSPLSGGQMAATHTLTAATSAGLSPHGGSPHGGMQAGSSLPLQLTAPSNASSFTSHLSAQLTQQLPGLKGLKGQIVLAAASGVGGGEGGMTETQLLPLALPRPEEGDLGSGAMELEAGKVDGQQQQHESSDRQAGHEGRPTSPSGSQDQSDARQEGPDGAKMASLGEVSVHGQPAAVIYYVPGYYQGGNAATNGFNVQVLPTGGQQSGGAPLQGLGNVMVLPSGFSNTAQ